MVLRLLGMGIAAVSVRAAQNLEGILDVAAEFGRTRERWRGCCLIIGRSAISRCLSELRDSGEKSGLYVDLIELINRIADYVIPKDNPSRERMGEVMGGQILKLRSEELREEGREEGRTLEIYSMVEDGDISPERAAKRLGIAIPVLRERMMESGYQCPEDQEEGIFRVYEACLKRKRGQNGPFPFG